MSVLADLLGNAWLTVAGQVCDLIGFACLASELLRGHREANIAATELDAAFKRFGVAARSIDVERLGTMDGVGDTGKTLQEFGIRVSEIDAEKLLVQPLRSRLAMVGIGLILLGFILQIIGTVPINR